MEFRVPRRFLNLKSLCSDTPVLAYADYTKPFMLHTDASKWVGGCVVSCARGWY